MNQEFLRQRALAIQGYATRSGLKDSARTFLPESVQARYSYNFDWMSRPIIQYPQDMVAMQEVIWRVRPDLIIETGIAHGGSLMLSASMLALLDYCDAALNGKTLDPRASGRKVIGIDVDIRAHNRAAIEHHPLSHLIEMVEGSSIDPVVIAQVRAAAARYRRILVCLDSNHTHDHVLSELRAYAPLTSIDSYCCVFDTVIEDLPDSSFADRPWGKGNNPKTAVHQYLQDLAARPQPGVDGQALRLEIDRELQEKLLLTVAPDGYLKRVSHVPVA